MAIKLMQSETEPRRRRFTVRINPLKLEGGALSEVQRSDTTILVETRLRFLNKPSFLSPRKELRRDSSRRVVGKNGGVVEWGENDGVLENICSDQCEFDLSFAVLRKVERKGEKWEKMGRVGMKIGDLRKNKEMEVTRKLPIILKSGGGALSASALTVAVHVSIAAEEGGESSKAGFFRRMARRMPSMNYRKLNERKTINGGDVGASRDELFRSTSLPIFETRSTVGFWKRTESFFSGSDKRKVEPMMKKMDGGDESDAADENGTWEAAKEIVSRDGKAELKCSVALASFDQCSEKVAGEGACSAIAAVVADWLHSNKDRVPNRSELDRLMVEGAVEWKKLGEDVGYVGGFPDKHFDIETVVRAGIRPVGIVQESSVVGFFSPEKFELLKGVVCVDGIWSSIEGKAGVYIVSWNDHFSVLKVEEEACYLIDSLGERLAEGCNQAFILRFDESSVMMHRRPRGDEAVVEEETELVQVNDEEERIICRGRECCKEFFKRFLAAILVRDLEIKEEQGILGSFDLHKRLQIEFQYTTTCMKK